MGGKPAPWAATAPTRARAPAAGVTGPLAHRLHRAARTTFSRTGGTAADVTQSAATGAAVEPVRTSSRVQEFKAARLRAWRVAGVAIRHEHSARERNAVQRSARAAGRFVKRASDKMAVRYA